METIEIGIGVGLAALAFWGFVATAVVAGVWQEIRKRDAHHETVRRLIESGQTLDEELLDKILSLNKSGGKRVDRDLKVLAYFMIPIAFGMVILGFALGFVNTKAIAPLLGVSGLIACIGVGALYGSKMAEQWYSDERDITR